MEKGVVCGRVHGFFWSTVCHLRLNATADRLQAAEPTSASALRPACGRQPGLPDGSLKPEQ